MKMQLLHTSLLAASLCFMFSTVTSQQKSQMVGFDGGYGNRYKAASQYGAQRAAYDRVSDFRSPGKRLSEADAGYGSRFNTAAMLARDKLLKEALMRTQDYRSPGKRSKLFRQWEE